MVFGVNCSLFVLGAVNQYHLNAILDKCSVSITGYSKRTVERLLTSFYIATSPSDEDTLQNLIPEANMIMVEVKFDLRGWKSTRTGSDNSKLHYSGYFGIHCRIQYISTNITTILQDTVVTKRVILFLPNGYL